MFDWGYEASNDLLCNMFGDARVAAAGSILSDEDLVILVPAQLEGNKVAMSKLLKSTVVQSTNSFGHLSEIAKQQAMKEILGDPKTLNMLVSELKKQKEPIRTILQCTEVQNEITIDHVSKGSAQQYSLARILNNPELLHRLTVQLWFDKKALEKILSCDAVKANNSFDRLHPERQAQAISLILSKPKLLELFSKQLKKNTEAIVNILNSSAVKSVNTFSNLSREAMNMAVAPILGDDELRSIMTKQLLTNEEAVMDILSCDAIRSRNTFTHLSLNAKTTVMTRIIADRELMTSFTRHLRDHETAIATVLNCQAVQELLTIDHICDDRSKQYSVVRMLNSPELLQRLCYQMRFDEMATEKILCCEAIRRQNSIVHLTEGAQKKSIDYILTNERLRESLKVQQAKQNTENKSPILKSRPDKEKVVKKLLDDIDGLEILASELGKENRRDVLVQFVNAAMERLMELSVISTSPTKQDEAEFHETSIASKAPNLQNVSDSTQLLTVSTSSTVSTVPSENQNVCAGESPICRITRRRDQFCSDSPMGRISKSRNRFSADSPMNRSSKSRNQITCDSPMSTSSKSRNYVISDSPMSRISKSQNQFSSDSPMSRRSKSRNQMSADSPMSRISSRSRHLELFEKWFDTPLMSPRSRKSPRSRNLEPCETLSSMSIMNRNSPRSRKLEPASSPRRLQQEP